MLLQPQIVFEQTNTAHHSISFTLNFTYELTYSTEGCSSKARWYQGMEQRWKDRNRVVVEKMNDVMLVYNNCSDVGIKNRKITEGREIELVREYLNYREEQFQGSDNHKLAVFLELLVGSSYPDIIFVEFNPEHYQTWNSSRDRLNKKDYKILYHIFSSDGVGLEEIVSQLGFTWKEAGLSLERLCDAELISRENGKWILHKENFIMNNIQAVEAKIGKWDKVLQQSIINKNFASETYALMDAQSCKKEKVISKFAQFGVGLCVKEKDSFKTIKKPVINSEILSFNSIMINELIGRILHKGDGVVNAFG